MTVSGVSSEPAFGRSVELAGLCTMCIHMYVQVAVLGHLFENSIPCDDIYIKIIGVTFCSGFILYFYLCLCVFVLMKQQGSGLELS